MPLLKPDPTFYPSPRLAMRGPREKLAFVAALNPPGSKLNHALLVVDVDPDSMTYGQRVGQLTLPNMGDELHHFGWNACSSALCPYAPHPLGHLLVAGLVALLVYEKLGLTILQKAWFNIDLVWVVALIASGLAIVFV